MPGSRCVYFYAFIAVLLDKFYSCFETHRSLRCHDSLCITHLITVQTNILTSQVSRSIDELEKVSDEMDAMRNEYREMKHDYEVVLSELQRKEAAGTIDRAKQRQVADMRSMVSVSETR